MLFFPPKIPIRCNLFSSNTKGKSLLVLMSNRLGKTTFPFLIEPFAPCLEAVWFSDACVRPRLLRLPAKPSSSGVSTTCLSSCFPFPFCSCTRRVRVKTVNRNYCISSNRYWVAVPRLACSRRLWLIVAPLNRASANTRAFFSRVFPTIWEPGNRLSLDHLSINRLPRLPHLLPSSVFFTLSLSSWSGVWSSKADQWQFKLWRRGYWHWKLIKEPNLKHFKSLRSV